MFKIFKCSGCNLPISYSAICADCLGRIKLNQNWLESPVHDVTAIAPLFYSISTTHTIFKAWKNNPGLLLQKKLFVMKKELRTALLGINANFIVPVPQDYERSWKRGHSSAYSAATYFSNELKLPVKNYVSLNETSSGPKNKQSLREALDRSFSANPFFINQKPNENETILLVDDLITTGSTLAKIADRLKESEPSVKIYAASLGLRPEILNESSTEHHNEFQLDQTEWIQERDFYSRFQYRI